MRTDRSREYFASKSNVSRETLEKLDIYAALLEKWSPAINLISKSTLPNIWTRHFLDSAQVFSLADPMPDHWADLGTGGGFPGMVVAIVAQEQAPHTKFTFVESDQRKAVFLQTVARNLDLDLTVVPSRIEDVKPLNAGIVSARALAPLKTLLEYADTHISTKGRAIFMKGASYRKELNDALEFWSFQSDEYTSITDSAAVILSVGELKRV